MTITPGVRPDGYAGGPATVAGARASLRGSIAGITNASSSESGPRAVSLRRRSTYQSVMELGTGRRFGPESDKD